MASTFPSEDWIAAWRDRLNENDRFAEVGADWGVDFNGDFVFTVEADETLAETHHYFVGLEGGRCTDAYRIDDPTAVDHGYQMTGPYAAWKRLAQGDVGAIEGVLGGHFEIDGEMFRVFQHVDAAVEMVETASDLETEFPG